MYCGTCSQENAGNLSVPGVEFSSGERYQRREQEGGEECEGVFHGFKNESVYFADRSASKKRSRVASSIAPAAP